MRIKKQFLNEEALKHYGFRKETIDAKRGICEYEREDEYATTLIQRCDGYIAIVMPEDEEGCYCDCTNIPDVVYHLIKDGLVEAKELTKANYLLEELDEVTAAKAIENTINLLIKHAEDYYGVKNGGIQMLIKSMKLKFDENGNIKE